MINFDGSLDKNAIEIKLKSNFSTKIQPTNSMRTDEYVQTVIIPAIEDAVYGNHHIISDNTEITLNLHWYLHCFWLRVNIFNENYESLTTKLNNKEKELILKYIKEYIEDMNNTNTNFIHFEDKDNNEISVQIYNGIIYLPAYNANTDNFIDMPKLVKTKIQFESIDENIIKEKIEKFNDSI